MGTPSSRVVLAMRGGVRRMPCSDLHAGIAGGDGDLGGGGWEGWGGSGGCRGLACCAAHGHLRRVVLWPS